MQLVKIIVHPRATYYGATRLCPSSEESPAKTRRKLQATVRTRFLFLSKNTGGDGAIPQIYPNRSWFQCGMKAMSDSELVPPQSGSEPNQCLVRSSGPARTERDVQSKVQSGEYIAEPIRTGSPLNQCQISFQIRECDGIVAFELPQIEIHPVFLSRRGTASR